MSGQHPDSPSTHHGDGVIIWLQSPQRTCLAKSITTSRTSPQHTVQRASGTYITLGSRAHMNVGGGQLCVPTCLTRSVWPLFHSVCTGTGHRWSTAAPRTVIVTGRVAQPTRLSLCGVVAAMVFEVASKPVTCTPVCAQRSNAGLCVSNRGARNVLPHPQTDSCLDCFESVDCRNPSWKFAQQGVGSRAN